MLFKFVKVCAHEGCIFVYVHGLNPDCLKTF